MKILHLYKTYFPDTFGGCEQVIKHLTKETSKLGCHNILLTSSPRPNKSAMNDPDLEIFRFKETFSKASCPVSYDLFKAFPKFAREADIIHYHFPWPYADFIHVFYHINKPIIISYHSDIVKQKFLKKLYSPLMSRFLNKAEKIVAASDNYLKSSEDLQPYLNKSVVIPYGIAEGEYPEISFELLKSWHERVGEDFILFIGVLRYYKGLEFLIKAVSNTQIPIVIAGDGPERSSLEKLAFSCNSAGVKFLGEVSEEDKVALLKLSNAVVLPSHLRSEAFGISLVEGLMYGKPLISTELTTGTSFINQHLETGFVVPPENPSALRYAITQIYENKALTQKMAENARSRFETYFTASRMANEYVSLYASSCDTKNSNNC